MLHHVVTFEKVMCCKMFLLQHNVTLDHVTYVCNILEENDVCHKLCYTMLYYHI